ncbi:MAG: TonB-dependent receptor, partial [Bacteroidales bacterium]|nr:TonB-dependent receptor [Bacteroidales bacterium]MBR6001343.1 TonB-dependent receptor [Bacteroidales bacterium]
GISARYTYQRALDHTDAASYSYGAQIQYIPKHSGSVSAEAEWKGWRADVSFLWTGTRYTVTPNLPEYALKPWTTLDVRLSKTFKGVTFAIDLNNICNTQYEVVTCYPMPRFNLLAGASYTF